MNTAITTVDEYIAAAPKDTQAALKELRATIKKAAPEATEKFSYGMPFYEYGGTGYKGRLMYFGVFKTHISLFLTPWKDGTLPDAMKKYHVSKATFQFPFSEPLPLELIAETAKRMIAERTPAA